jgi:HSF-type DNA-binding
MPSTSSREYNGLSHLVEAATALTALTNPSASPAAVGVGAVSDDDCRSNKLDSKSSKKKDIFPQKLMEILSDSAHSEIITWLPHGRSFVMIRPDMFTEQVLPKYMPSVDSRASTKYPSFTRKLNRWYVCELGRS